MFLSKIRVNRDWAKDPYQLHRALWQLFPNRPAAQRDFLFRVESPLSQAGQIILLQSALSPQGCNAAEILASKMVDYSLCNGQQLSFKLRANPVKSIHDARGRLNRRGEVKSCRVPLINDEELLRWLMRKFNGATIIDTTTVTKEPPLYFNKHSRAGKIQTACFEGLMQVTDAAELQLLLNEGIGPAKSMGCGMLSLARR